MLSAFNVVEGFEGELGNPLAYAQATRKRPSFKAATPPPLVGSVWLAMGEVVLAHQHINAVHLGRAGQDLVHARDVTEDVAAA